MIHCRYRFSKIFALIFFLIGIQGFSLALNASAEIKPGGDEPTDLEQLQKYTNVIEKPKELVDSVLNSKPITNVFHVITDQNEWEELECEFGLATLNRTVTRFGLWGLRQLMRPIADKEEIMRRQALIRLLVDDQDLFERIQCSLQKMSTVQDALLAYWKNYDVLQEKTKKLYYNLLGGFTKNIDRSLNTNRWALECSIGMEIVKQLSLLSALFGLSGLVEETIDYWIAKDAGKPASINPIRGIAKGLKAPIKTHNPYPVLYADGYKADFQRQIQLSNGYGSMGDFFLWAKGKENGFVDNVAAGLATAAYVGYKDYIYVSSIHDAVLRVRTTIKTAQMLQEVTADVATFFAAAKEIKKIIEGSPALHMDAELNKAISALDGDLCKLEELLETPTFKEKATSPFFFLGRVLLAHRMIRDLKQKMIPLLQAIGEIDAYLSIAKLYKEHQDKESKFCFAEFVDADQAYMNLDNFWLPLIPVDKTVRNSISWGDGITHNNVILSGPNGGGKSTTMKGVAWAVMLGQSWGIVPARQAQLSLFTGIRTSINPHENIQQGLSTFMAEKERMDSINKFLHQHNDNDRFLVLLDEPYRGTVESEASYRVSKFAQEVADKLPLCVLVVATHLEGPTHLEDGFAHYHLGLIEKDDLTFERTFKLELGPAVWWFKDIAKRARFIDQLLEAETV